MPWSIPAAGGAVAALSAILHLRAEYRGTRRQVYLFKPLTTVTLLLIAALAPPTRYDTAIILALIFSLAGDVFLMLPGDRFVAGLTSFLLAHAAYIFAFTSNFGQPLLLAVYAVPAAVVMAILWPRLGRMRVPVTAYMCVIVVMAWQAAARAMELRTAGAILAATGGALFVVSDAVLALNRFRVRFRAAEAVIMTTYVAAQWCIAASTHIS